MRSSCLQSFPLIKTVKLLNNLVSFRLFFFPVSLYPLILLETDMLLRWVTDEFGICVCNWLIWVCYMEMSCVQAVCSSSAHFTQAECAIFSIVSGFCKKAVAHCTWFWNTMVKLPVYLEFNFLVVSGWKLKECRLINEYKGKYLYLQFIVKIKQLIIAVAPVMTAM